jgi:hypothetical protein
LFVMRLVSRSYSHHHLWLDVCVRACVRARMCLYDVMYVVQ